MPDDSPRTGLYASRPIVRVDGQSQDAVVGPLLQSVMVEETTLGLFRCEMSFENWGQKQSGQSDFLLFDGTIFDFGKTVSVEFGPPSVATAIFTGRVMGIEAGFPMQSAPEVTILAEDRLQDLRMTRRTRSFADMTDSDVFQRIAGDHGLTPQIDMDGPQHKALTQVNQSDLAFLRERAAAIDAQIWVDGSTLYAQARSRRKAADISLTYQSNLLEFQVLADLAHQRSAVRVTGWDVAGKQAIDERADSGVLGDELGSLTGGSSVLSRAFAERVEEIASAMPLTSDDAQAMAKARYRDRARRFLTGSGIASGEPKLRVGAAVTLKGVGVPFEGVYFVTRTRHTFDLSNGYRTEFDVERAGLGNQQ